MKQLDKINSDLQDYNHYWRKYLFSVLFSYIPQILFEIFSCLYVPMQNAVFVFGVTLCINMILLVSQVCIFSAGLIHKVFLQQYLKSTSRTSEKGRKVVFVVLLSSATILFFPKYRMLRL